MLLALYNPTHGHYAATERVKEVEKSHKNIMRRYSEMAKNIGYVLTTDHCTRQDVKH